MCTEKCSRFIALSLYPLALISIICNIILFFPDWSVTYAQAGRLTEEVKYMGGLIGGLPVLNLALFIHLTGKLGCCANCSRMFLSIAFAVVGVAGALYSCVVAALGLVNGPLCKAGSNWATPFKDRLLRDESYLMNRNRWALCTEPKNVVEFNVGLFSTLLVASGLQLLLCALQTIISLFSCLLGTCLCAICTKMAI